MKARGQQRKRELLGREVAGVIRDQILNGEIQSGDHLVLTPLAEMMGTSITPVREALMQLSQDGWLIHEAHRGFRVVPLKREDVQDTYFIWATAESEIARRAAQRAEASDIDSLRAIDTRLQKLENHHTTVALTLNDELHSAIHAVAASAKLAYFADTALRSVPLKFDEIFPLLPGWADINRYGHAPIIDAIDAHDEESSAALMRDHFLATGNLLISQLDKLDLWSDSQSESSDPL